MNANNYAEQTGKLLAYSLITDFIFKNKSVSLIGFSMGTEVIVNCLDELSRLNAFGIIQNVYFLGGAALDVKPEVWNDRLKVVAGRITNVYSIADIALLA